jgi:hypothetical protein
MDIFTFSSTNPGQKTNIIDVIKVPTPLNVADLSHYRPVARLPKRLNTHVNIKTKYWKKRTNMKKKVQVSK